MEAVRLLERALAALPAEHPSCAATADKIRARLAAVAGLAGGGGAGALLGAGGGGAGGPGGLESPGGGGLLPMTPSSLMLHAHIEAGRSG